jgi:hypothetical protein
MFTAGPKILSHLVNRHEDDEDDEGSETIGPRIPAEILNRPKDEDDEEGGEDDYLPSLPPSLLAARSRPKASPPPSTTRRVIGPSFPPNLDSRLAYHNDDDSDDEVGPKPLPVGVSIQETDGVRDFMEKEERRRKKVEVR